MPRQRIGYKAAGFHLFNKRTYISCGFKPTALPLAAPYQYDKHHLVPIGEFIPPFAQWFIDLMMMPLGAFNRGGLDQAPFYWQGQHLNIARLRSMELARPTIRATNTGATVIIDANGKVTHSLERHTRGVLVGQVVGNTVITPYAAWVSRFWLWPLWILGLGVLLFGFKQHIRHTA